MIQGNTAFANLCAANAFRLALEDKDLGPAKFSETHDTFLVESLQNLLFTSCISRRSWPCP